MRFYIFLFGLACFAIIAGVQDIRETRANPEPIQHTVDTYLKTRPDGEWVRLTNGNLDVLDAAYEASSFNEDNIQKLYIPMYAEEETEYETISILVMTDSSEMIALYQEADEVSEDDFYDFIAENFERLFPSRDVQGMVTLGTSLDSEEEEELHDLYPSLTNDFIILDEGGEPGGILWGVFLIIVGLVILAVLLMIVIGSSRSDEPEDAAYVAPID